MYRVGREVKPKWPAHNRVCFGCNQGKVEDIHHFIMDCTQYDSNRRKLITCIYSILKRSNSTVSEYDFNRMDTIDKCDIILGKRTGDVSADRRIDSATKRYLTKAWNLRSSITDRINCHFKTSYRV